MNKKYVLVLILIIGAVFRFYNPTWDLGYHLHPDERFLTMVGNAMKLPNSVFAYFNPALSTFNPANVGFTFFVYGDLPLIINKLFALVLNNDSYVSFTIQGRLLSGFADLLIVLLIYKTVLLFEKRYELDPSVKYWASFLYAIAVLPIQLSHFFAVDTFLNLFLFASFYCILRYYYRKNVWDVGLGGIAFGCALASKVSAVFMLPLILTILFFSAIPVIEVFHPVHLFRHLWSRNGLRNIVVVFFVKISLLLLIFIGACYGTVRITYPYLFEHPSFLDPRINTLFLENIRILKTYDNPEAWFPPSVQWLHKTPLLFSLTNLVLFGIGIPYFILLLNGFFYIVTKHKRSIFIIIALWMVAFFLYQSTQFIKVMRYFIFLYPFYAIIAAFGLQQLLRSRLKKYNIVLMLLLMIWPVMFFSIYVQANSRIAASQWIYQHVPSGSLLLSEYWDDPLPLQIVPNYGKQFNGQQLPVFDPDTQEKWQKMNSLLQQGDYLILSSNRGWGSMPTVPERYPLMTRYYQNLFLGNTSYRKVAEFTSYPSLKYLGIPIQFSDDFADESFTVYDHPKVLIFKKIKL